MDAFWRAVVSGIFFIGGVVCGMMYEEDKRLGYQAVSYDKRVIYQDILEAKRVCDSMGEPGVKKVAMYSDGLAFYCLGDLRVSGYAYDRDKVEGVK